MSLSYFRWKITNYFTWSGKTNTWYTSLLLAKGKYQAGFHSNRRIGKASQNWKIPPSAWDHTISVPHRKTESPCPSTNHKQNIKKKVILIIAFRQISLKICLRRAFSRARSRLTCKSLLELSPLKNIYKAKPTYIHYYI